MLKESIYDLKSGTDIRGIAIEGVPGEPINLDIATVRKIGGGFLIWLENHIKKPHCDMRLAVGHDSRLSAEKLKEALFEVFFDFGVTILDCGLASTPAMFMTTVDLDCDAAISITASHHPFNKNGFKFFTKSGGVNSQDIDCLLECSQKFDENKPLKRTGQVLKIDYVKTYAKRLRDLICNELNRGDFPLEGLKIVVDAGNGAGGFFATEVLLPLGADISGSQFLEPDGRFPNHIPNPEDKEAMAFIKKATLENHADLGIIFDTDVDRVGAVDSSGEEINRNNLIGVAATIALDGIDNGVIVTDSVTSNGLKKYIEEDLKGEQYRFKRGYKNVINEAIRLNKEGLNCPLAIETSGHAALRENYFLDDGAYLVTKIIIFLVKLKSKSKSLKDILEKIPQPKESAEYRLKITAENFKEYGNMIISSFEKFSKTFQNWHIATDSKEGIKVDIREDAGESWVLLRMSVHDPILVINIESDIVNFCSKIKNTLNSFLSDFPDIENIC